MSLDQLMCEWVFDTLSGVSATVVRRDQDQSNQVEPPRVTYIPIEPSEDIAGGARVYTGSLALRVESNRPQAFGTGDNPEHAGELHTLEDAVDALIDGAVPTLAGHTAMKLRRVRVRDGDGTQDVAARTLVYSFVVYKGFGGIPLSGGEGTLTIAGYDGEVRAWQVQDSAPLNTDATGLASEHPQYRLGDNTASLSVTMFMSETDVPLPSLGETTANFQVHSGAAWTDTIKIHRRRWGMQPGTNEMTMLMIEAVIDSDSSPFLTGVIP